MSFRRSFGSAGAIILLMYSFFIFLNEPAIAASSPSGPIVNPKQVYTYEIMSRDLKALASHYPDLIHLSTAGSSEYGRTLWTADIGKGPAIILLLGSHHAREWITTINSMMLLDQMAQQYEQNTAVFGGYRARDLLDQVTFRIVPMVNPDGVALQQLGLSAFPAAVHASLIQMNNGSRNFKSWKANGKGVDLNRSYPAGWEGIHNPASGPSFMNYKGTKPLQAKEAQAIYDLTLSSKPEIAVAYHSSGEILYWNYKTKAENVIRDKAIAKAYANMTGYQLIQPQMNPSGGGFTDWFITQFGHPGLTPELGRAVGGDNVPLSEWGRIWQQQKNTVWLLAKESYSLWLKRQPASPQNIDIRVTAPEKGYRYPDMKSKLITKLEPGRYTSTRLKGDWLEVKTAKGLVWISAHSIIKGPFDVINQPAVAIGPETGAFGSPLDLSPSIKLTAQTANVLERWHGWLLIKTINGAWWIQEPQPSPAADPQEEVPELQQAPPEQAETAASS